MIPITSSKTLGKALKQHRKKLALTQSQAGARLNIPQKTISGIESGKAAVRITTLFKYMSALGLEIQLSDRSSGPDKTDLW